MGEKKVRKKMFGDGENVMNDEVHQTFVKHNIIEFTGRVLCS